MLKNRFPLLYRQLASYSTESQVSETATLHPYTDKESPTSFFHVFMARDSDRLVLEACNRFNYKEQDRQAILEVINMYNSQRTLHFETSRSKFTCFVYFDQLADVTLRWTQVVEDDQRSDADAAEIVSPLWLLSHQCSLVLKNCFGAPTISLEEKVLDSLMQFQQLALKAHLKKVAGG